MSHSVLTLLIALPFAGGLCALAFQRGGRAVAVGLCLLAFALASGAAQRFLDPRYPTLERDWERLLAERVARAVGGAGAAPAPIPGVVEDAPRVWAPPPEPEVQEGFLRHLLRGGGEAAREALLDDLSGVAVCRAEVQRLSEEVRRREGVAPISTTITGTLDATRLAVRAAIFERARLEVTLRGLEASARDLRRAGRGPLAARFKLVESRPWMPGLGVEWLLGVDGLALGLVWLLALLGLLCGLAALERPKGELAALLFAQAGLTGALCALDVVLLCAFWTLTLAPTYALIAGEAVGGDAPAARRAVLPGFLGALLLVAALVALGMRAAEGSTNLLVLTDAAGRLPLRSQAVLFAGLFLACATRAPLPPLHGWLTAASAELSPPAAAFLQGGVLALGGFGLLRLVWPLCPQVVGDPRVAAALCGFAALTLIFSALAAIAARDLRRVLALTTVGSAGLVLFGLATATPASLAGSALELCAHGLAMGAACLALGALVERTRDADLGAMGGLLQPLPRLGGVAGLACLSLVGLPGMIGFVARLLLLAGAWQGALVPRWLAGLALSGMALTGLGLWWTWQRVFLGERHGRERLRDLSGAEGASQLPLVLACVLLGVAPPVALELLVQGTDGLAALLGR
ncbi:MAG: NuoM family protein [Planctomycetota bacterium]